MIDGQVWNSVVELPVAVGLEAEGLDLTLMGVAVLKAVSPDIAATEIAVSGFTLVLQSRSRYT